MLRLSALNALPCLRAGERSWSFKPSQQAAIRIQGYRGWHKPTRHKATALPACRKGHSGVSLHLGPHPWEEAFVPAHWGRRRDFSSTASRGLTAPSSSVALSPLKMLMLNNMLPCGIFTAVPLGELCISSGSWGS